MTIEIAFFAGLLAGAFLMLLAVFVYVCCEDWIDDAIDSFVTTDTRPQTPAERLSAYYTKSVSLPLEIRP